MESEDVSKEVQWEARRMAKAIDADEFRLMRYGNRTFSNIGYSSTGVLYRGLWGQTGIEWVFDVESLSLQSLRVGNGGVMPVDACMVYRGPSEVACTGVIWGPWVMMPESMYSPRRLIKEHMVRTLYRFGIDVEGEEWLAPLGVSLSAHEKTECRLTMPREFWPKKWLEKRSARSS